MATIGGQTLKALVDAMLANPDGYYASFATTGYDSGVIAARVNGSNVDLQGDVNATGCVDLVIFLFAPLYPPVPWPNTRPSLPLLAPPFPLSPFLAPPYPSLSLLATSLSNATTYDYDIRYHVRVSLNDSGEPIGVVIKKGADVALTVLTSDATWTNRTLSNAERAKLGGKLTPKGRKGKQPPPPPPPLGYNYETSGTWLNASTLTADNGQTYKELADAMLAAPDTYSALIYTKTFENGVASGAFGNVTKGGGEASGKLAVKVWFYRVARIIKHH
ncbi:unnamed protein product [Closterium sp. Naga37s-1]|nr:unnamed protein product [Closterium sp. Naga37s-1]CAI5531979.1 unnamed protein product [Closterium sp. Naga37s-1]